MNLVSEVTLAGSAALVEDSITSFDVPPPFFSAISFKQNLKQEARLLTRLIAAVVIWHKTKAVSLVPPSPCHFVSFPHTSADLRRHFFTEVQHNLARSSGNEALVVRKQHKLSKQHGLIHTLL